MAKPRRVSVQGRGADLFFTGDDLPPSTSAPSADAEQPAAAPAEETGEELVALPAEASAPTSTQASKQEWRRAGGPDLRRDPGGHLARRL